MTALLKGLVALVRDIPRLLELRLIDIELAQHQPVRVGHAAGWVCFNRAHKNPRFPASPCTELIELTERKYKLVTR